MRGPKQSARFARFSGLPDARNWAWHHFGGSSGLSRCAGDFKLLGTTVRKLTCWVPLKHSMHEFTCSQPAPSGISPCHVLNGTLFPCNGLCRGYSATAEPGGRSREAYVIITKTKTLFEQQL